MRGGAGMVAVLGVCNVFGMARRCAVVCRVAGGGVVGVVVFGARACACRVL